MYVVGGAYGNTDVEVAVSGRSGGGGSWGGMDS